MYLSHFLKTINHSFKTNIKQFSGEALEILVNYDWPGNVRELINVLEQTAVKTWGSRKIRVKHLPDQVLPDRTGSRKAPTPADHEGHVFALTSRGDNVSIKEKMATAERELIFSALRQADGNKCEAAKILKMPRSTFYFKLKKFGTTANARFRSLKSLRPLEA